MTLIIPNSIDNDTPADAAELQENFGMIQTYVNNQMVQRDGSVSMAQPLLLSGDPTQPNHAANKNYVDTNDALKVNKDGSVPMTGPLIALNARVGGRLDGSSDALFSHKDAHPEDAVGIICSSAGDTGVVNAAGRICAIWNKKASEAGHDLRASFNPTGLTVYGSIGANTGMQDGPVLTLESPATARPYLSFHHYGSRYGYLQTNGHTGELILATDPAWDLVFNRGGIEKLRLQAEGARVTGRVLSNHSPINGDWNHANYISENYGSFGARIAFWHPTIATQLRYGPYGDLLEIVNWNSSAHGRLMCLSVTQTSSLDTKRDVRPLRADRKISVRNLNPDTDTVDTPDVMALRPIIYRPKVEPVKLLTDSEGKPTGKTKPWPKTEVFGREARREQLGLIADEVQHVLPSAVNHSPEGKPLGIDYSQITIALLDHVQQLTDKVAALEAKLS